MRLLASQLYAIAPQDAATLAAGLTALLAAGGLACDLPARRAARLNNRRRSPERLIPPAARRNFPRDAAACSVAKRPASRAGACQRASASGELAIAIAGTREGRRLVDALIVWITPDRQLKPRHQALRGPDLRGRGRVARTPGW